MTCNCKAHPPFFSLILNALQIYSTQSFKNVENNVFIHISDKSGPAHNLGIGFLKVVEDSLVIEVTHEHKDSERSRGAKGQVEFSHKHVIKFTAFT